MFNKKMLTSSSGENWITSASGRRFKRHDFLPGTVMQWNDNGTTRTTLILDAAYRTKKMLYSDWGTNLNLTTHTNTGYSSSTGSSISLPADPTQFTDTSLNSKSMANQDQRSSTVATNQWQNSSYYGTAMQAVYYVRNTLASTSGIMRACDLPTINCLTRIFGDMVILDSMDPTVSTYSEYALSTWFGSSYAWSSSWYGNNGNNYNGLNVNYNSNVNNNNQNNSNYVVPVLENI